MNDDKKSFLQQNKGPLIVLAIGIVAAAIAFPFLPEQIPMQWNASGAVSRMGSRWEVFLIGALPAIVYWGIRRKYFKK